MRNRVIVSLLCVAACSEDIDVALFATREAIRLNWENLESATFAGHDLSGINLYLAIPTPICGARICPKPTRGKQQN
jgi:hypothetical protein